MHNNYMCMRMHVGMHALVCAYVHVSLCLSDAINKSTIPPYDYSYLWSSVTTYIWCDCPISYFKWLYIGSI